MAIECRYLLFRCRSFADRRYRCLCSIMGNGSQLRRRLACAPGIPAARRGAQHEKGRAWGEVRWTDMQQQAARFLRRRWPAPPVFLCRNPGAFWSPDSGRKIKPRFRAYILKQYMSPESGLDFVPGIWAPKCARIPARQIKKSGPCGEAMVQLWCHPGPTRKVDSLPQHGRDFGLSISRRMQFAATTTTTCGSGRAARDQWV